jgi:hypothetical membrane protein
MKPWMLAGMVAFVPHLLAVVLATFQRPGFSHTAQYLSELGERGSVSAALTNFAGIVPTGVLFVGFGIGLAATCRSQRHLAIAGALIVLHGACRMLAAFFPCDPGCRPVVPSASQSIHNLSVTVGFVSLTTALFVVGAWLIARKRGAAMVTATYAAGALAVAAQALVVLGPATGVGLYQRVALGALQLWVALLALHLSRGTAGPTTAAAHA